LLFGLPHRYGKGKKSQSTEMMICKEYKIIYQVKVELGIRLKPIDPSPALVIVFQSLWTWNALLVALIYLGGTPNVAPVTMKVANLVGSRGQDWELLTAAAFVSMALPLVIFFSLQRYFVRGILAGSLKG